MRKILTGAAILALSTGLLTGCSGMIEAIEKSANYSDVEKIDYNLYRISGTRPNINQQLQLREFLYQRAQDFCMRNGQGAQLIAGVSGKNPKGEGVKAIVVFRCVGLMRGPVNTFIDNSPEADAARAEAARIAREMSDDDMAVVAPVDGRVIKVEEAVCPYTGEQTKLVSIFMNVFNVHSQKTPVAGKIEKIEYFHGRYLNASLD